MKADIKFENHGSIFLARPLTNAGVDAVDAIHEQSESQMFGNALVVEPRYVLSIIDVLREDFGLVVA